mgnify:CR=1 FL=1
MQTHETKGMLLGFIGVLIMKLMNWIERRLLHWQ